MMYCYTSSTTGNPKGVAYTQRSTYLHTISNLANFSIATVDDVLPVVPMFHAAAWGYPFQAVPMGAKLTYPGGDLSPTGLVELMVDEGVTFSAGVPTVWLGIQHYLEEHPETDLPAWRLSRWWVGRAPGPDRVVLAGTRDPRRSGMGHDGDQPVAAVAQLNPWMEDWEFERQLDVLETVPNLDIYIGARSRCRKKRIGDRGRGTSTPSSARWR
jgi:fatty-acyl-CoA synthase